MLKVFWSTGTVGHNEVSLAFTYKHLRLTFSSLTPNALCEDEDYRKPKNINRYSVAFLIYLLWCETCAGPPPAYAGGILIF